MPRIRPGPSIRMAERGVIYRDVWRHRWGLGCYLGMGLRARALDLRRVLCRITQPRAQYQRHGQPKICNPAGAAKSWKFKRVPFHLLFLHNFLIFIGIPFTSCEAVVTWNLDKVAY